MCGIHALVFHVSINAQRKNVEHMGKLQIPLNILSYSP